MHQHPDQSGLQIAHRLQRSLQGEHLLHRRVAEELLRERRRAARNRRRFFLRYRFRNLVFRLFPRLAKRWAL